MLQKTSFLIFFLIISSSSSTLALLGVLSLDTAWTSAAVWRPQGEVDVLLAVQTNHKGGDIHHLLADTVKTKYTISSNIYVDILFWTCVNGILQASLTRNS